MGTEPSTEQKTVQTIMSTGPKDVDPFLGMANSDAAKLRVLAAWFDQRDNRNGYVGAREVQNDLRRIADDMDARSLGGAS